MSLKSNSQECHAQWTSMWGYWLGLAAFLIAVYFSPRPVSRRSALHSRRSLAWSGIAVKLYLYWDTLYGVFFFLIVSVTPLLSAAHFLVLYKLLELYRSLHKVLFQSHCGISSSASTLLSGDLWGKSSEVCIKIQSFQTCHYPIGIVGQALTRAGQSRRCTLMYRNMCGLTTGGTQAQMTHRRVSFFFSSAECLLCIHRTEWGTRSLRLSNWSCRPATYSHNDRTRSTALSTCHPTRRWHWENDIWTLPWFCPSADLFVPWEAGDPIQFPDPIWRSWV